MKKKDRKGEAAPVPMVSARKHGRLQEAMVREAVHSTHGQRREARKTTESCGVMDSSYLKVQICRLSLVRVWVTVGTGPQCCNGETFRPPIKGCILYCKRLAS